MGGLTGGKGQTTATQTNGPPAWAIPYLQTGMDTAMKDFNHGAGAYVGTNPDQQSGWNLLKQYATGAGQQTANSAQSAYQYLTNPSKMLDPNNNQYLQSAVQAALHPITDNYQQVVRPGINNDAISSGLFGGSRQGVADAAAASNYLRQLGDTSSTMYSNAYNAGLNAMTGALGDTGVVQQAGEMPGQLLGTVGQQEQQASQAKSDAPFTQLQKLQQLLGGFLGYSGTTGSSTTPGPSALQNATSLAAIAAAIYEMWPTAAAAAG